MKQITLVVAVQLILGLSQAGFFFNDVKPKTYKKATPIRVDVGHIVYKKQMWKKEFYSLNFCSAGDEKKHNITTFDEATDYDP